MLKKIIVIYLILLLIAVLVCILIPDSPNVLSNNEPVNNADSIPSNYLETTVITTDFVQEFNSIVAQHLASGRFTELEDRLSNWKKMYKDPDGDDAGYGYMIDRYRADLTFYNLLLDQQPMEQWTFYNADILAAVIAFSPISIKYKSFIDRDSDVLPPADQDILLSETNFSYAERLDILNSINLSRTDDTKAVTCKIYEMLIHGYKCQFTAITTKGNYMYQPYSIRVLDSDYYHGATYSMLDSAMIDDPLLDLDTYVAFAQQGIS